MQKVNKNTRYTELISLESITQSLQVIVTHNSYRRWPQSGLNRQERRLHAGDEQSGEPAT